MSSPFNIKSLNAVFNAFIQTTNALWHWNWWQETQQCHYHLHADEWDVNGNGNSGIDMNAEKHWLYTPIDSSIALIGHSNINCNLFVSRCVLKYFYSIPFVVQTLASNWLKPWNRDMYFTFDVISLSYISHLTSSMTLQWQLGSRVFCCGAPIWPSGLPYLFSHRWMIINSCNIVELHEVWALDLNEIVIYTIFVSVPTKIKVIFSHW